MIVTLKCVDDSLVSLISNGKQHVFVEHSHSIGATKGKILRACKDLGIDSNLPNKEIQDLPGQFRNGILVMEGFLGLPTGNKLAIMYTPNGYIVRFFGLTKDFNETVREMREE